MMRFPPKIRDRDLAAVTTPIADWLPSRREVSPGSLDPKGRIFIFGLLAGSYGQSLQPRFLGINLNAPWVSKIFGALLRTVLHLPFRSVQDLRQVPQLAIPQTAHGVHLRIFAQGFELGRDRGLLWAQDGILHYEGLETRFAVGLADLVRIEICDATGDPHSITIRSLNSCVSLSLLQVNLADRADVRHALQEWSRSSSHLPSQLLPPVEIQPRKRSYLLKQTIQKARIVYAMLAGLVLVDALAVGSNAAASLRFRIDAIVVVAALHLLTVTYRKVRRDEEFAARNYRPFTPPPVVTPVERTAAEVSVGVRLNAL